MKSSKGLRSGGIRKKVDAPSPPEEDGIRVVAGKVRVRDRAYLSKLHESTTPPLDLSPVTGEKGWGPLELHHTRADGQSRRQDDSGVVPLHRSNHQHVEMNPVEERNLLGPLFGTWSSFSYWAYTHGVDPRSVSAGEQFRKWVLLKIKEEQDDAAAPVDH